MFRVKKNKKQQETANHPMLEKFKTFKFMNILQNAKKM